MVNFCENCGGSVYYSPKDGGNRCEVCGNVSKIPSDFYFEKNSFDNSFLEENELEKTPDFLENVKCNACGATLKLSKYQLTKNCPYCNNIIQTEQTQSKIISVDSIIPFHLTRAQAYKKLKKASFWRLTTDRKALKKLKEEDVVGVYANSFSFDIDAFCKYSGVFTYTEKDKEGNSISKPMQKRVYGMVDKNYKDILIEANHNLEQQELLNIMPYNFDSAFRFDKSFMQGYVLQNQDKSFGECFKMAEKIVKDNLKHIILKRHNCDEIQSIDMQLTANNKKYNYCLLPIYFAETTQKYKKNGVQQERKIKVLINGQTGKVSPLPKNPLKFFLWLFAGCSIVVAILLLCFLVF